MGRTWILALSAVFAAGLAPSPGFEDEPPLSPGAETPVSPPQTPHSDCVAKVLRTLSASHARLDRAMVSRSRRWGDVWRADFETDDVDPPLVNRAVCWQGAARIAVSQSLAPLPVSLPSSTRPSGVSCIHTPFENPCKGDPVEVISSCVRPGVFRLTPNGAPVARRAAVSTARGTNPSRTTPIWGGFENVAFRQPRGLKPSRATKPTPWRHGGVAQFPL